MKRTRAVLAYVLVCAVAGVLLGLCGACMGVARPAVAEPRPPTGLTFREQRAAAMYIFTVCQNDQKYIGSGVLVASDRVLTAAHVVMCANDDEPPAIILAGPAPDRMYIAEIELLSLDRDLARLRFVDASVPDVRPARLWAPAGERTGVCMSTAFPTPSWSCGEVSRVGDRISHGAPTAQGNSGSGIYDMQGNLVAIATQCFATIGVGCNEFGGKAVPVADLPPEWREP